MEQDANVEEDEHPALKSMDTVVDGGIPFAAIAVADAATPSDPTVCEVHSTAAVADVVGAKHDRYTATHGDKDTICGGQCGTI